jgi:hypothetical protein
MTKVPKSPKALGRPVKIVATLKPVAPPNLHERSDYGSSSFFLSGDTGTIKKRSLPGDQRAVVHVALVAPPTRRAAKTVYTGSSPFRCCHCISFAKAVVPASANGKTGDVGIERITDRVRHLGVVLLR